MSLQHERQLVEIRTVGVEYRSSPQLSGAVRDGKKEFALHAPVAGSGWGAGDVQCLCVEGDGDRVVVGV